MKEVKICKIVQDLLPNYIEKLTNEDTNKYIEEHLKQCDECNEILKNMKKDLKVNKQKRDNREVKYIKKYSNKLRILKFIILIILLVFVVLTIRKMVIISNLSKNTNSYVNSNNYHKTSYSYDKNVYTKGEIFSLGDKKKIITTSITDKGIKTMQMYGTKIKNDDNEKYLVNIYIETEGKKTAVLNKEMTISTNPQNTLYTENLWQLFIYSLPSTIKKSTFEGEECYYIANFNSIYSYCPEGMYINKKTGLPISLIAYEYKNEDGSKGRIPAADYVYEFDTVKESEFIQPNISEYEVEEDI